MTGPRRRQQLVGPINENKTEMYHCFTDFVLAHLKKSPYQVGLDDNELAALSDEEREQVWAQAHPHPCRTTCPGAETRRNEWREDVQSDEDDDYITNESGILAMSQRPTTRSSTRSSEAPTMMTPLLGALEVDSEGEAPGIIQAPPSPTIAAGRALPAPTLAPRPPLAMPTPLLVPTPLEYQPAERPPFTTFSLFENKVNETRDSIIVSTGMDFRISAASVSAAAQGFVNVLKGIKQDPRECFCNTNPEDDPDFEDIGPATATLTNLFSWQIWMFKAYFYLFLTTISD